MASSGGALNLLAAYGTSSDDSEEEIPGPRVSVKRSIAGLGTSENSPKKVATDHQKKRLPSPSGLLQCFNNTNTVPLDLPHLHNERIRSFPHERGNWASYVYIAVEPTPSLQSFIDVVCASLDNLCDVIRNDDLHISLSKTVVLKHHWIDSISSSVQSIAQSLARFSICFGDINVYTNEEKTRTFIGIVITAGHETLLKISHMADNIFADFKLPPFYQDASFHMSIVSCVGNHTDTLNSMVPKLQTSLKMFIHSQPLDWSLCVEKLCFRTGNKYFNFNFVP
ncbi:U6 snRNA phosphodiesterase [Frankliniella fusca]|uniref:U6 snRNA phosphodiesterase n=1 Tax=Frankliniella fusca TaxID=407009 RepID=A0AAE1HMI1_9NEOP|nr:U6 snRNA phosphodiesterase [Frankliniella fusca]